MNVLGKDNYVVGGRVGGIVYYLGPKFRVMLCDLKAVGFCGVNGKVLGVID